MPFFLRRRHSLRLILAVGIIIMILLFFATLIQFDQIETNSYQNSNGNRRIKAYNSDESMRRRGGNNNLENENVNNENNAEEDEEAALNNDLENINFKNRLDNSLYQNRILNRFNKIYADANNFRKKANLKESMGKVMNKMERYVHLDLKGSPPKLAYLKELIPYMKNVGASGLLIEYEDYFPYSNDLESIKNQNHYTKQEMTQLFALLKESQLKLIPLIQTYGHMEFVLKLKEFAYLREAKQHYQVITPCLNDTYDKVIYKMIDQILEMHPEELEYIHIGCDEVYHVNVNPACSKNLNSLSTIQDFFIYHVSRIVDYVKSKRPNLGVLIWDDMIRKNMQKNKELAQFAKKVIPMVWNYNEILNIESQTWEMYDAIFNEIWIASAFKGATRQLELIPNAAKHYNNHLSWLNLIETFSSPHKIKGIALTGWSRYDHAQSVCEIMPSAIPSLILCLQTIINYDKDKSIIFAKTKELSKCEYNNSEAGFVLDPSMLNKEKLDSNLTKLFNIYKCDFPGSKLYNWILNLKLVVQHYESKSITISNILNNYNMKNKFFNSMIYEIALNSFYPNVKAKLNHFLETGEIEFDKYFYADLYEELSNVYILRYIDEINVKLTQLNKTELPPNLPIRPFNKIVQSML